MRIYLNILPDQYKKRMQRNRILFRLRVQLLALAGLLVFLLAIMGSVLWGVQFLSETTSVYGESPETSNRAQLEKLDELFMATDGEVRRVGYLIDQQYGYTRTLDVLATIKNEGVYIEALSFDGENGSMRAYADVRDGALRFQDLLEQEMCFSDVEIPIGDLVQRERISFSLEFTVDRACLEKV